MNIAPDLQRHAAEFQRALQAGECEMTAEGILFPRQHALVGGVYTHNVNGEDEQTDHNLVTTEGLNYMLNVALRPTTVEAGWYLALFGGNVSPLATWTAANFVANSSEITSTTAGYSESTRRGYVPAAASAGAITNTVSKAVFTIASSSTLAVYGGALVSSPTRGGGAGVLMSASKFAAVRNLENADVFNLGYSLTLTSA